MFERETRQQIVEFAAREVGHARVAGPAVAFAIELAGKAAAWPQRGDNAQS